MNDRFLTAAAAVEAFHRHEQENGRAVSRAEHRARVKRLEEILNAHDPDLAGWAVDICRPENKKAFKTSVIEFASDFEVVTERLVGDSQDLRRIRWGCGRCSQRSRARAAGSASPRRSTGRPLRGAGTPVAHPMRTSREARFRREQHDDLVAGRREELDWCADKLRIVAAAIESEGTDEADTNSSPVHRSGCCHRTALTASSSLRAASR